MPIRHNNFTTYTLAFITLFSGSVCALELGYGDWQAHGFASQGYTYTSGNNFFGPSQGTGSLDFREIGVNLSGHLFTNNLLIAAQGLYRDAGGSDNDGFRLDFANIDYRFTMDEHSAVGIRGGRVKNPFGIYNDTRDVIWTRPSVTLPQSIYFDALALRQAMISSDGFLFYGRHNSGDHSFSAEFVVSEPRDNTGGATEFLTGLPFAPGEMSGDPMYIGRVGYYWKEGRFKLLFSIVDLNRNFTSASASVPSGNVKALYPLVSAQLNLENWSITGEYGQVNLERTGFPPTGHFKNTSESFYLQTEYRFAPRWTALLRFDAFFANIDDRSGKRTSQLTMGALPRYQFFSKDITFGLRWEFARNFMVAADYHRVYGTGWLSPVDNPGLTTGQSDPRWDLFSLMFSVRF